MYEAYYGLSDKPFSMLPDPGYLYLSKKHETALTLLEYALVNKAGFCVVTGEPGAGKTTLLRKLLEAVDEDRAVGMITNTHASFGDLLDWVLSAFSIHDPNLNRVEKNQRFVDYLLEQYANHKTTLLIVDEAQNLPVDTLEELRMLSNINSEKDQILQIILAGQPQLKDTLRTPELMQFAQRIAVDYHLDSLNLGETCGYIQHRLTIAGAVKDIFTPKACERIYQYSGGTPRLINLLCDTALVYGFADHDETVDEKLIDQMVSERMRDSVVPLFKEIDTIPAKPVEHAETAEEIDFPWINQHAETRSLKPEASATAEKKTVDEARADTAVVSHEEASEEIQPAEAAGQRDVVDTAVEHRVATAGTADRATADKESEPEPEADAEAGIERKAQVGSEQEQEQEPQTSTVSKNPELHEIEKSFYKTIEMPAVEEKNIRTIKWPVIVAIFVIFAMAAGLLLNSTVDKGREQVVRKAMQEKLDRQEKLAVQLEKQLETLRQRQELEETQLRAQAATMQQERDQALARAEEESKLRVRREQQVDEIRNQIKATEARIKAEAKKAVQKEKLKQKAIAKQTSVLENELNDQRKKLYNMVNELERTRQEAEQAAKKAAKQAVVVQAPVAVEDPSSTNDSASVKARSDSRKNNRPAEFASDPCEGPQARFLSTCR